MNETPMSTVLTPAMASKFASLALAHLTREYPNSLAHVLAGPQDIAGPRALHPIFYGSFDWHSCVHGYWLILHLLERFPDLPEATRIVAVVDAHFTEANVEGERAYFDYPHNRGFERPYGWAWLLALSAKLDGLAAGNAISQASRWRTVFSPLTDAIVGRFEEFLPKATYPLRVGTHYNTAFALALAYDFARDAQRESLAALIVETAKRWYLNDVACQAWEPSGDEFLSPSLMEAELMRRVLPPDTFGGWFTRFLPELSQGEPATLFIPATVSDRSDGKITHLDGLNLSRAWCMRAIARALPEGDVRRARLLGAAEQHIDSALAHVTGDYLGEHWLATFATLALDVR